MKEDNKAYFNTKEVLSILRITKNDLYTILRPQRSKGALLPPIFKPESTFNKIIGERLLFTHRDIIKLRRYFKALKEYKSARDDLRKTSSEPYPWYSKDED